MRADIGHHARDVVNSIPSFHGQSVGDLQLIRQCHFNYSAVKLLDNRLLDLVDTEIFAMILAVMPMLPFEIWTIGRSKESLQARFNLTIDTSTQQ